MYHGLYLVEPYLGEYASHFPLHFIDDTEHKIFVCNHFNHRRPTAHKWQMPTFPLLPAPDSSRLQNTERMKYSTSRRQTLLISAFLEHIKSSESHTKEQRLRRLEADYSRETMESTSLGRYWENGEQI